MNLQNNKGYVMTDVSIAIIILLILIPTIMGLVYNIGSTKRATDAKSEALNIAINTIEAARGSDLQELNVTSVLENIKNNIYKEKMSINENIGVINTNKSSYRVSVDVIDYADTHSEEEPKPQQNIVKTVSAKVEFRLGGETKEIILKTVIK